MTTDLKHGSIFDNILAAFIFFTRLPFWRLRQPPRESYRAVVEWWPLVGWLTGTVTAAVIYFGSMLLPYTVAIAAAIVARLLTTGALHEDGLADFFDGFGGGGTDRQRILAIMKDSRIGTYGVLALVLYELLLFLALYSLTPLMATLTVLAADPFSKMVASQLVMMMPYARREEEAKSKIAYRRMGTAAGITLALQGLLPMGIFLWLTNTNPALTPVSWDMVLFIPALVMYFLYLLIWRRLRGYTGDCCGAVCLLVELTVYIVVAAM